jgi:hypothetical protein
MLLSCGPVQSTCPSVRTIGPYWGMPLWLSIPIVAALWVSSWISGLDLATGDRAETYVMWSVTAIASALLLRRLVRAA